MYPHVLTAAFAASSPRVLRRVAVALPAWTAVLALFGLLGIAALAARVEAPETGAEAAVPILVDRLMPAPLAGLVFGAINVGALVPAAVMSIAAATSFVRNVYAEYFHPTATLKRQVVWASKDVLLEEVSVSPVGKRIRPVRGSRHCSPDRLAPAGLTVCRPLRPLPRPRRTGRSRRH